MSRRGYSKVSQKEVREFEAILDSIERSRKRNLSVGLLRGDRVQDELLRQEVSTSPNLKRSREDTNSTEMSLTMADFKAYMDQNTNRTLRDLQASLSLVDDLVKANSARLDRQEATIRQNQAGLSVLRDEMRKLKDQGLPTSASTPRPSPSVPHITSEDEQRAFQLARRSLRLWPIRGTSTEEIWQATWDFIDRNLGLGGDITEDMIDSITWARVPLGPGVSDEALVVLREVRIRDLILRQLAFLLS